MTDTVLSHTIASGLVEDAWDAFRDVPTSLTGPVIPVVDAATGREVGAYRSAAPSDVDEAVDRALRVQAAWAALPAGTRVDVVYRAAELLQQHAEEFVQWGMAEAGALRGKAAAEVAESAGIIRAAAALVSQPRGEVLQSIADRFSYSERVPVGVVGVISPWNFPINLAVRAVAPALAMGNAVVLKPDHQTAVVGGALLARIFSEAGVPDGLFQVLPGRGDIGAAVVAHRGIPTVSFTGSTATGRIVAAKGAEMLKHVSLELGGNNPLIVLDDVDVEKAAALGSFGTFLHQGQICLTTGRHLVHRSIADEYVERIVARAEQFVVGDPADPATTLGPLINRAQASKVLELVHDGVEGGARLLTGGQQDGPFVWPTVLDAVSVENPLFQREIFGPVVAVTTFESDEEAIALANAVPQGLSAGILSPDLARARAVAERLHVGMVHINDGTVNGEPSAPFGGVGESGTGGRFGGAASWDEFTTLRWTTMRAEMTDFR